MQKKSIINAKIRKPVSKQRWNHYHNAVSPDLSDVANKYKTGLDRSELPLTDVRDQNFQLTLYIIQCYRLAFNRQPDQAGLMSWCEAYLNGEAGMREIIAAFLLETETANRNLTNREFVQLCFDLILAREDPPTEQEINQYVAILEQGYSREICVNNFTQSAEFATRLEQLNLH